MVDAQEVKAPLLLNVFIQTVIDKVPFCYRTEKFTCKVQSKTAHW